ncbi:glycoside hydrolase family 25 protein [Endozoicomonas sp. SCSIO W0465]|uniref:glycoside hydrolase family 25 protein n=1 Tax=Endozoicomonas sp. SCSIO W0465 TaxID=2918516 RepID=UPI0020763EE1|nr:GH25 family lysozyme [Endozoicomonas sp. SCSIO W0465]USE34459.1 hypothetical protein MJO57_20225 [Endozoicomonas sp. SCSIO W0465]
MDQVFKPKFKLWFYVFDTMIGIAIIVLVYASYHRIIATTQSSSSVQSSQPLTTDVASEHLHGIDVSHYQGSVDWQGVSEKFHFAFIKATEGKHYVDPQLRNNINEIKDTSMNFSVYHFYTRDTDPVEQARHFLEHTSAYDFTLPPVLDIEVHPGKDLAGFHDDIQQWLDKVSESTGCTPIIYTNKSFWNKYLKMRFSDYPLWISDYTSDQGKIAGIPWSFWQYSDNSIVHGIGGHVDQSLYRGNEQSMRELGSCRV